MYKNNSRIFIAAFVLGAFTFSCAGGIFLCPACAQEEAQSKEEESLYVAKKAFEDGFYDVSLGLLERFLRAYPTSEKAPEANLLVGECYFHLSRFLDSLGKFEELLKDPAAKKIRDAVLYWIAEVHFKGNNFSKAAAFYQKVIDEYPQSSYAVSAYYSLGWSLFQEQRYKEALESFSVIDQKFPGEPVCMDSRLKIIECLYNLKDYGGLKSKLTAYEKYFAKDPIKLSYLYFYAAEAQYYTNNFEEAVEDYARVLRETKDDRLQALAKLGIGWSNLKLKKYKEAQDAFVEVEPDNLEKAGRDVLLLGNAVLFLETKRYSEARQAYDELLRASEDQDILLQGYLGKADALYNMAEYKDAVDVYRKALESISSSAPQELIDKLHYGLAWAYLKEGEFKLAIEEFQKIAKQSEDKVVKVAALCQIGDTYQDSGEYNKAIDAYDAILRDYPDSFYSDYVQYQLGLTLLKSSQYDSAILALRKMIDTYQNSKLVDDATYALGLTYFQREDYNASKDIFTSFQQQFKDSSLRPQAMYLLGTSYYNLSKFAEAIEVFKSITREYSQDQEMCQKAEYEIADAYYRMGNEAEAMSRFKSLRAKYPDSSLTVEVMWWLGEYYYRHQDFNLARRYFSALIHDFPSSNLVPDAYYALGSIDDDEGKFSDAIDNFKKVTELGKADLAGTAVIAMADVYAKSDQIDLALKTYRDAVEANPNYAALIYPKIAEIYRKLNNYSDALEYYRKSLKTVSVRDTASIQFKIAEVMQAQEKFDEAIDEYLKVTYLYADNQGLTVKALLRVAGMYEDAQKWREAVSMYKKIVGMNVDESKFAQERIDALKANIK